MHHKPGTSVGVHPRVPDRRDLDLPRILVDPWSSEKDKKTNTFRHADAFGDSRMELRSPE